MHLVAICSFALYHVEVRCARFTSWVMAGGPIDQVSDMGNVKLLKTVERWLRTERSASRELEKSQTVIEKNSGSADFASSKQAKPTTKPAPYFPSRHMAYFH